MAHVLKEEVLLVAGITCCLNGGGQFLVEVQHLSSVAPARDGYVAYNEQSQQSQQADNAGNYDA